MCFLKKVSFSFDIILCGWLCLKHQLTSQIIFSLFDLHLINVILIPVQSRRLLQQVLWRAIRVNQTFNFVIINFLTPLESVQRTWLKIFLPLGNKWKINMEIGGYDRFDLVLFAVDVLCTGPWESFLLGILWFNSVWNWCRGKFETVIPHEVAVCGWLDVKIQRGSFACIFSKTSPTFFPELAVATTSSCVGPQNKIDQPAGCRFPCWVPAKYK